VITATEQTAGRGRHARAWVSGAGNLYASLLLRPKIDPRESGQFALLAGLSAYQAVRTYLKEDVPLVLKWPNDILLDGRKCCGILVESDISGDKLNWLAVGVGLNIETAAIPGSACLRDYAPDFPDARVILGDILQKTSDNDSLWQEQGFDAIRREWVARSFPSGEAISVKIGEKVESGAYRGLDSQGNLLMLCERTGEEKVIAAGEVFPAAYQENERHAAGD
jgi:BirA family biotin operon repressor/biotin-[acetyl-CoA-carboxylase] ligase